MSKSLQTTAYWIVGPSGAGKTFLSSYAARTSRTRAHFTSRGIRDDPALMALCYSSDTPAAPEELEDRVRAGILRSLGLTWMLGEDLVVDSFPRNLDQVEYLSNLFLVTPGQRNVLVWVDAAEAVRADRVARRDVSQERDAKEYREKRVGELVRVELVRRAAIASHIFDAALSLNTDGDPDPASLWHQVRMVG